MSAQAIEKIRETEQNAEIIESAARADAKKILEDAETEAKLIVDKATVEGRAMVEKAIADATEVAERTGKENRDKSNGEISALESITEKKFSQAVCIVKDKLIS